MGQGEELTFSLVVTDDEGEKSIADTVVITVEAPIDVTDPTVQIQTSTTSVSVGTSFDVDVAFDETVTGFEQGDVDVSHGTVTDLTGSGQDYTLTVLAVGTGDVEITIPANVVVDVANNGNEASNTLVIGSTVASETQTIITSFVQTRTNHIIVHQPDLIQFLSGSGSGSFRAGVYARCRSVYNEQRPRMNNIILGCGYKVHGANKGQMKAAISLAQLVSISGFQRI